MALRLTGTSLTPENASSAAGGSTHAATGGAFGAALAPQARTRLLAGDLEGYRALFAQATEHGDPHARYHARVLLIEEGLRAVAGSSSASPAAIFAEIARAALDALEQEAREPLILAYAAVAMYELWSLDAAHALFEAATRLEPSLPHLRRNLEQLKERRRTVSRSGRKLRVMHPAVPSLAARAKRVASKARPATGLKLSLCMIVRDEEEMLPRCLAAVAPAVDEIVIVDTGSQDRTIEIARSFGARVIEREWTGSFAEARNVSFEAATGDWIIYLDADEILVAEDVERLREVTGRVWREAFYLVETNYTGEVGDGSAVTNNALRVFRNRPHYRFEGRLHEQIAHHLPTYAPSRIEQTPVRIDHYGYLGAVRDAKEKSRRNIELLRTQLSEGQPSAFMYFNLGTELSVAGDATAAVAEFERAWQMVKGQGEDQRDWVPALISRLVGALTACGRATEAIAQAQEGLERFPGFTDLVFAQARAALSLGRQEEAIDAWRRCLELGDAPARYVATVGSGTYLPRIALAELHLQRGEIDLARQLLDECISDYPEFAGVVHPYAEVRLAAGVAPEAVIAEIEERIPGLATSGRFMLASALYRAGAMDEAERLYREVLASRPTSAQVKVALAESLLQQRKYAEAATQALTVAAEDPFAALAARIELWGLLAAGDLSRAAQSRDRAVAVGIPAAQLEVFDAWAALAAGEGEPKPLPVAATPLLGVILETLLRVHDFETFERLLPLLERSALPAREQRELLGSMYLRYGFLASAAQEWMAICQVQPDARALAGLARVALAHGQGEEAIVFATEALKLDPTSPAARDVVARCAPVAGALQTAES